MRFLPVILLLLVPACGQSLSDTTAKAHSRERETLDIAEIAASYPQLKRMTPSPVLVNISLARYCIGASQQVRDEQEARYGPHTDAAIIVYMNDLAANAFGLRSPTYPVGSVVVKEKVRTGDEVYGVGGMVKRKRGYDTSHGNWEYFYFAKTTEIESGKLTNCIQCHQDVAVKDYVFGDWADKQ